MHLIVTACENIVAIWDYVSIHLIEKCFQKLGSSAVSQQHLKQSQSHPRNIWDNIPQVLKVQVPFADYIIADDAVEMIQRLSDDDTVDLVKGRNYTEEEEGEDPDNDDDDDDDLISSTGSVSDSTTVADESEIIHQLNFCI